MKLLHVAAGVIKNNSGQVLISLRDESQYQGGLWEFPGGKVETTESVEQALARELKEELDISVQTATPLIVIHHEYPDSTVQLHVFSVEFYSGVAKGCEGQSIKWVEPENLVNYEFPLANRPIITAARLPPFYAILNEADPALLLANLKIILNKGTKLIQARLKNLSAAAVESFLQHAYPLCKSQNTWLLLSSSVKNAETFETDGLHLTSADLLACKCRPEHKQWVAASCHNLEELRHAGKIGVDFVVLAPVLPTPTHPDAKVLGWNQFADLCAQTNLPAYALGGLSQADLLTAQKAGGQGIAAVRAFLE